MNKKILVGMIVVAIIAISGYLFLRVTPVPTPSDQPTVGAVSTLDAVDNPYVSIGGVRTAYISQSLNATSSYVCIIRNPFNATSTLLSFSMKVASTSVLANQKVSLSTTTVANGFGTSSPFLVVDRTIAIPSDSFAWVGGLASTTNSRLLDRNGGTTTGESMGALIKPSEYINVAIATTSIGNAGSFSLTGFPSAYWKGTCGGVFLAH